MSTKMDSTKRREAFEKAAEELGLGFDLTPWMAHAPEAGYANPRTNDYFAGYCLALDSSSPAQGAKDARALIEGAWCAGYYDAGYTHDSGYACMKSEQFADEALAGTVAQAERGAPEALASTQDHGKAAFEKFCLQMGSPRDFEEDEHGFRNPFTRDKWLFWVASRDALAASPPPQERGPEQAHRVAVPDFDLRASEGGRGYVAWHFANVMKRQDFGRYIKEHLAADFACCLAAWLREQPVTPTQQDQS